MPLTHEPDVSVADWFVRSDARWQVLASQGPPGFEAYATVWFDTEDAASYRSDDQVVAHVTRLAAGFTTTPERAWFGLWDGWGNLEGDPRVHVPHWADALPRVFRPAAPRTVPAAFDDAVLDAPRVDLRGDRTYLLFTGPVHDVGEWGGRPYAPDHPRDLPQASVAWPEDRAWFITSDVDPSWFTVGGSQALVDAVLADAQLDAEPVAYGTLTPHHHEERS